VRTIGVPRGKLGAGAAQHPGAELMDQAVVFRDRHEDLGRHGASRPIPAHQRLDRAQPAAIEADDRLVARQAGAASSAGARVSGDAPHVGNPALRTTIPLHDGTMDKPLPIAET